MVISCFIRTGSKEEEEKLNTYRLTTLIVEVLSNAAGSKSEGLSPSGDLIVDICY